MDHKELCSCLKLDSYDVEIPFSSPKTDIIGFFQERNIPFDISADGKMALKSRILLLDITFLIFLEFDGEKIISVAMLPDRALEGKALYSRFSAIQKALKKELGSPDNGLLESLMNWLVPDGRSARWRREGVAVKHYLRDRFGMEEIIHIELCK
ncbi:MAG: hypothetical protein PUA74_00995 [Clostridiales bacterium]|nr:hypothetical protein [Clostridiales bacterium]